MSRLKIYGWNELSNGIYIEVSYDDYSLNPLIKGRMKEKGLIKEFENYDFNVNDYVGFNYAMSKIDELDNPIEIIKHDIAALEHWLIRFTFNKSPMNKISMKEEQLKEYFREKIVKIGLDLNKVRFECKKSFFHPI
ncbi:hypothetical protein M2454_002445 [Aequitasia blattaphilus]|uniref:Uncharacterized protein n=1 Tax=Aequitasia blattaphilus TaxID=2949332 RepID=A0ABT1EB83_9FIRM|nr:hypothetical protein [Aequitasia blattaphilus]MCP1103077.1 hypothetical protein [Aequitasia blattaphilus]MCR8615717.1 hypothetical protein [Aequitasia blattaphilus]